MTLSFCYESVSRSHFGSSLVQSLLKRRGHPRFSKQSEAGYLQLPPYTMWWSSRAKEWPQHRASPWTREWTRPQPWAQWEPNSPRHTERGRRSRTRGRSDGRSRSRGRSSGRRSSSISSAATDVNDEGADDAAGFEQTTSRRRRRTSETTTLEIFECSPTFSNADDENYQGILECSRNDNNLPEKQRPRVATSKISDSQSRAPMPQQQPQPQPQPQPRSRRQQQKQFKAKDNKFVIKGKPSAKKAHDEAKARLADLGALAERFPSSLAAGIMKRDQEASAAYDSLPRRVRTTERCYAFANQRNQFVADSESKSYQEIDKAKKHDPPQFRTGQSIFQYWAKWMATAKEPPTRIKQNNRPKWYSGELIAYLKWDTVIYAGLPFTGHTYTAF